MQSRRRADRVCPIEVEQGWRLVKRSFARGLLVGEDRDRDRVMWIGDMPGLAGGEGYQVAMLSLSAHPL